jgi:hypothetical protein
MEGKGSVAMPRRTSHASSHVHGCGGARHGPVRAGAAWTGPSQHGICSVLLVSLSHTPAWPIGGLSRTPVRSQSVRHDARDHHGARVASDGRPDSRPEPGTQIVDR